MFSAGLEVGSEKIAATAGAVNNSEVIGRIGFGAEVRMMH
jgi:hypothetical protein